MDDVRNALKAVIRHAHDQQRQAMMRAQSARNIADKSWHERNAKRWAFWRKHHEDMLKQLDD